MKKTIFSLTMAFCVMNISCTDKTKETTKEIIVVPAKTTEKTASEKSTSITVGKAGVKVETKKLNVDVKK